MGTTINTAVPNFSRIDAIRGRTATAGLTVQVQNARLDTRYVLTALDTAVARAEAAEAKLAAILAMADRSMPKLINIEAIRRVLDEPTTTKPTAREIMQLEKGVPRG